MDLRDVVAALLRQWLVCLIGLIVMIVGAGAVILLVPTTYQANAQLVFLLPAQVRGDGDRTNPFLNLDSSMTISASLIVSAMTTEETHKQLEADGFSSEYSMALTPGSGPVILLSAVDTDPQQAVATRDEVIERSQERLAAMQQTVDAPESQTMTINPQRTESAEAVPGSKIRALAAVAAVGGVLTLLGALLRDRRVAAKGPGRGRRVAPKGDRDEETDGYDGPVGLIGTDAANTAGPGVSAGYPPGLGGDTR